MIRPWIFEFFGTPAEFHERFDPAPARSATSRPISICRRAPSRQASKVSSSASIISARPIRRRRTCLSPRWRRAPRRCGWAPSAWCRRTTRRGSSSKKSACNMRHYLHADPRLHTPERPAVLDTPTAHAFSIGDDEVIAGLAERIADEIVQQCRTAGAGHFAANFNRSWPPEVLKRWYAAFGKDVIPKLRSAAL